MAEPFSLASALGSGVGSGALGAVSGGIGQLIGYGLNAMAASKAHDRSKNMITRGPTYAREGLLKAGINPILAAGAIGPGVAKAPQASGVGSSGGNAAAGAQIRALNAQAAASAEQARLTKNQADVAGFGVLPAKLRAQYMVDNPSLIHGGIINEISPNTPTAAIFRAAIYAATHAPGPSPESPTKIEFRAPKPNMHSLDPRRLLLDSPPGYRW